MGQSTKIVLAIVAVAVALVIVGESAPVSVHHCYYCYCGASMTRDAVLFISRPDAVRERKVSRYWQRNVEPNHVHKWVRVSGTDRYSLSVAYSDGVWNGGFPPRELTEDAVIAVLRSLPTPSMRKLFMRQLWDSGWKSEDFEKSSKLYRDLQAAYESSPTRRDYRDILRRYGYRL